MSHHDKWGSGRIIQVFLWTLINSPLRRLQFRSSSPLHFLNDSDALEFCINRGSGCWGLQGVEMEPFKWSGWGRSLFGWQWNWLSLRKWRELYWCKRKENLGRRIQENILGCKLCVALPEMVWRPVWLGKENKERKSFGQVGKNSKLRIWEIPELHGKGLLLKTPHTFITGYDRIKLGTD